MKHRIFILPAAAVFCTALALGLSACGSGESASGSAGVPVPAAAAAGPQTSRKMNGIQKAKYDDSLVTDAVSMEERFQDKYGTEYNVSIHVPKILSDAPEARRLNQRILETWGELASTAQANNKEGMYESLSLAWKCHWNGSLLSLVVEEMRPGRYGTISCSVFHYDFAAEKQVEPAQALRRLNISEENIRAALSRAAAQDFDHAYGTSVLAAPEELAHLRAGTIASAADAVHALRFYPDPDGSITAFLTFFVPAGAGYIDKEVRVPLHWENAPLQAGYNGIAASVNDSGRVEVLFAKGSVNEHYQDMYGFVCGKTYPVSGCFSNYKKIFVGRMGPDYNPYLFLLTDQGAVEFVSLFKGTIYGKLVNSGPIFGLPALAGLSEIAGFEPGTGEGQSDTVFAVGTDGSRYDLAELVRERENCFPYSMSGSWGAAAPGNRADYAMELSNNGLLAEIRFRDSGNGYSAGYSGILDYMGMDETGMIYGYTLTGPDGNILTGSLSLLPREKTLRAGTAGGDDLLKTDGYLQMNRI